MRREPKLFLAGLLVITAVVSACSGGDSDGATSTTGATSTSIAGPREDLEAALQQNRELWESQDIDDYSYVFTASDHSGGTCTAGVDVRAAEVVTVEVLEGDQTDLCPSTPEDLLVESLFDQTEERIGADVLTSEEIPDVELSFDSDYGYITAASFPNVPEAVVAQSETFEVEDLEAVAPGSEPQYSS